MTEETGQLKFLEYDAPGILSGEYEITLEQTLSLPEGVETFKRRARFFVNGKRFALDPADINARFPPDGNLGDYRQNLPHISLTTPTLPWQRFALDGGDEDSEPWMALLVIDEQELDGAEAVPGLVSLETLAAGNGVTIVGGGSHTAYFPGVALETGQEKADQAAVIDIKKRLLQKILPTYDDLKLLAHVRHRTNDADQLTRALAVILANRLPRPGSRSMACLVSLEARYSGTTDNATFNYGTATDEDYIRLVSLKNWSFHNYTSDGESFEELVKLIDTGALRKPASDHPLAEDYLRRGYVPAPYRLREGSKMPAWYHGPLSPRAGSEVLTSYIEDADQMIRYHRGLGMFDVAYGCAFELGRLLGLNDPGFSSALYNWKRVQKQQANYKLLDAQSDLKAFDLGINRQIGDSAADATDNTDPDAGEIALHTASAAADWQQQIIEWFNSLNLLNSIPFNYLVPDADLLPRESIRFFRVDNYWMQVLRYGAFSLGRVTSVNLDREYQRLKALEGLMDHVDGMISGFILRSQLVSGWPDLQVDGYAEIIPEDGSATSEPLPLPRRDYLADDVLLCLFAGEVRTAEIYLEPQGLQFGVDGVDTTTGVIEKDVDIQRFQNATISGDYFSDRDERVLDIAGVANALAAHPELQSAIGARMTGADFGMLMIEGSVKGRFVRQTTG